LKRTRLPSQHAELPHAVPIEVSVQWDTVAPLLICSLGTTIGTFSVLLRDVDPEWD